MLSGRKIVQSLGEHVNGDCHTNGIERFWSLLKRQIIGSQHFVPQEQSEQYVAAGSCVHRLDGKGTTRLSARPATIDCKRRTDKALVA